MTPTVTVDELRAIGRSAGLDAVGVAPADPFERTRADLLDRRAAGLHGGMNFTYRNPERSTDPARALASARSLVVGAMSYAPPAGTTTGARVAAYATDDHYGALRCALQQIADRLHADGWETRVLVDDNALVDREAAFRAGIGWYGKSSNVLLPGRGSWFVLGSIVTDAPLEPAAAPVADGCGACRRCIDGCPTGAIVAPGVVDARRCLAWLLQAGGDFPEEFRVALGDRIYGCDECQEVCPPNRRSASAAPAATSGVDVLALLNAVDEEILEQHGRWYIPDRDPRYVRRNALVVLGNIGAPDDAEVRAMLERYADGDDEMLAAHASWAAQRLRDRASATA